MKYYLRSTVSPNWSSVYVRVVHKEVDFRRYAMVLR